MGARDSQTRGFLRPLCNGLPNEGAPVVPSWRHRAFRRLLAMPSWVVALPFVVTLLVACVLSVAGGGANPIPPDPHHAMAPVNILNLLLLVVAVSLWGASSYFRCTDALIRRCLHAITVLCLFWLVDTLAKYQIHDPFWMRALWYLYYLPMTLVPSFLVVCAARVARVDRRPVIRQVERAMFLGSLALSLVVLTNDLHHLAFVPFDSSWPSDCRYGPAYLCVYAWTAVEAVTFLALLLSVARTQLRSVLLVLAGLAVGGERVAFHPGPSPDLVSRAYEVCGGIAVLTEDTSVLGERRRSPWQPGRPRRPVRRGGRWRLWLGGPLGRLLEVRLRRHQHRQVLRRVRQPQAQRVASRIHLRLPEEVSHEEREVVCRHGDGLRRRSRPCGMRR